MRQSMLSALVGVTLGLLFLSSIFCGYALLNSSWGRAQLPGPVIAPPLSSNTQVPTELPPPTLAPLPSAVGASCGGPERMTLAFLGVDDREANYARATRTDAIMLVTVNFKTHSAALLSIPRDLYVPLPNLENVGLDQSRLNTAYLYGEVYNVPGGGPAEFKETIELNFAIRVDRYVMVNFGAFEAAVDALGGIEVNVPEAIYDPDFPADEGGTIIFEVPVGVQHMNGQTALRYARTRHQDDDYHRTQRQQLVLFAIRDKLLSPTVIPQIPALLQTLSNSMRSDLSPEELAALACIGPQIDRSQITALAIDETMVLPWTTPSGGRVSIPNREAIAPIVREFLSQ